MAKKIKIRDPIGRPASIRKAILDMESRLVAGWNYERYETETNSRGVRKIRAKLLADLGGVLVGWCLYENTADEVKVIRMVDDSRYDLKFEIIDAFIDRLIQKLYRSRRRRLVLIVNEDRQDVILHLRDTDYDDHGNGFEGATSHSQVFQLYEDGREVVDADGRLVYRDGIEMEYRKRNSVLEAMQK